MTEKLSDIVALQDLTGSSLVVDVGGYQGAYADEVLKRYDCGVIIFEPVFYKELIEKYKGNEHVRVHNLALGNANKIQDIYIRGEGTSFWKEWAGTEEKRTVLVVKASMALKKGATALKLNCEGSEYEIIEDLHKAWLLTLFQEILVQFHKVAGGDRAKCEEILSKTHERVYNQKWSLWRKKHA